MTWLLFLHLISCYYWYCALSQSDEIIYGPSSPNEYETWMNMITKERTRDLSSINYNGSIFNITNIQWSQSSFIQPQMHGFDQYFYDINTHSYTYQKWLNDLNDRYGGIDAMLFWVTYTNLGADDRNQFEMMYSIPGGLNALKQLTNYMHSQHPSIKVLFPYNPWDTGTNPLGMPDYQYIAKFLNETNGDGFNGDTMNGIPYEYYSYSVSKYNHPIVLQPENYWELEGMNWDTMGWGYWNFPYDYKPFVDRWKWYDARHMTNIEDRWTKNHTNDIQNAFLNAIGIESWENVWGIWMGIVPRDGEAIRRTATILRYFGNRNNNKYNQNYTQSLQWKPFIPIIGDDIYWNDLFASSFIVNNGNNLQEILYLIVNRNNNDINNALISFHNTFIINPDDIHIFDCYYGNELNFTIDSNNFINLYINIEGLGFGAILVTMDTRNNNKYLNEYLIEMNNITQISLNKYDDKWKYLLQTMTEIKLTPLYTSPPDSNMVHIPYGIFFFNSNGVEIEGDDSVGVDVQYSFEMHPKREHQRYMTINPFYIDKYPVTCKTYKTYLDQSGYQPNDTHNFLKNWIYDEKTNTYNYPKGYDNKPVTYLGLDEARLFCSYYKKRLPHSYEWQYAAQGNTSYLYPWGNQQKMGINFPQQQNGTNLPGPDDVNKYEPQGNSVFGVTDLVGNVWQYTDEFTDIHTRSVIVRGSSNYRPTALDNAPWYFPTSYQLNQHNKYFLMDNSYERCGTIGFRCVSDIKPLNSDIITPMFWNGKGTYCNDYNITLNGILCGKIITGKGYNNLTDDGKLDWIQFGINNKDNSPFKMIRKNTNIMYINNITSINGIISIYDDSPNGYYWNDGQNDIQILSINNASTYGVFISNNNNAFSLNVNNLIGGNMYKLKLFVGVFQDGAILDIKLNINNKLINSFQDNTVYYEDGTVNVVYEIRIDLSSISSDDLIKLLISWIVLNNDGNITLQAITLQLLQN